MMDWNFAGAVISALAVIGVGVQTIWSTRQDNARRELKEQIKALETANAQSVGRLQTIEADMKHLPSLAERREVYEKLNDLGKEMSRVAGAQEALLAVLSGAEAKASMPRTQRRRSDG